ncbi:hypothetical protein [Burkholderia sp. Ac-20379]|uniref:hypothetical protein n=1 Tax=Burkholderia sp. Ac-20379 TaxID=2703900 RepID=UPI0019821C9A|nr:hypothetical protein [Burkholderia sp. Ac-20379]MBN3727789.1 hypothetical protein [Burkholderia sp. Ac-20379]
MSLKPARRAALTLVGGRHAALARDADMDAPADRAPAVPDAALPPGWFEESVGYVGECAAAQPLPNPTRSR